MAAFVAVLRDLANVEGQDLVIERRDPDGPLERLPALVGEVLRTRRDRVRLRRLAPDINLAKEARENGQDEPVACPVPRPKSVCR